MKNKDSLEGMLEPIKDSDIDPEDLLYPEVHISKVSVDDLQVNVIDSGFSVFNDYSLLKENRSELIIIAARPSMGKSALMFQIAEEVSKRKTSTYIFSLEMDKEQIMTRMIAQRLNQSASLIQKGMVEKEKIFEAKKEIDHLPIYINDKSGLNMPNIMSFARDAKQRLDIGLIVIDYLQLIKKEKGHSTNDEVGAITLQLKALAKELKIPIIVGSQLSRACEQRDNKAPILSDLRDSGNIEQDADMVLMLYRPHYYDSTQDPTSAKINVAKNRNGPVGHIDLKYIANQTRFMEEFDPNLF